jgi:CTP synthase (UTP-ammonia lyase)
MPRRLIVGVIGDFNPQYDSHTATNLALGHAAIPLGVSVDVEWIPTPSLKKHVEERIGKYDALLCAPGSPYRSMRGALNGIRFAREFDRPFLGTCGGFQYVVIEYARNVMGFADAQHAEENPDAPILFVTRLSCSLVGKTEKIKISSGSRAFYIYGKEESEEQFHCNFGLNPTYRKTVEEAGLHPSGFDQTGEVRILELPNHLFYLATLFVPQMTSSKDRPHPVIRSLLEAAVKFQESRGYPNTTLSTT